MSRFPRRAAGALLAAAAMLLVTACGGSTAGDEGKDGADSSVLATAADKVAEFEKTAAFPTLPAPYEPGTGKIAIIACGLAGPDCKKGADLSKRAAEEMGWQADIFDAQFSPQKGSAYIDQAVQQGYDGIISVSQAVETMKAAVDNATSAGIPVVCAGCFAVDGFDKVLFAAVDWEDQGRQVAWSVIERSKGKAKVLVYDSANLAVNARVKGFTETLKAECPSCEIVQDGTIDAAELAKPGPPTFAADLTKYPVGTLTDVVDPYNAIGVPMMKTLKQNGRTDVFVSGYDATPEAIEALNDGSLPIHATTGFPRGFMSYAAVDLIARTKAGAPTYDVTVLPSLLVTKNNASTFTDDYYEPTGLPAEFQKTWGK